MNDRQYPKAVDDALSVCIQKIHQKGTNVLSKNIYLNWRGLLLPSQRSLPSPGGGDRLRR